ncbi:hypothetical protein [Kineococcus rhizosphaerae]|uniref:Phosphodiesterase n=1 Tax=Kineococcus rhizosphaerae TaxID=559628 RepID=A0A2T0QYT5_9ACTN|nr:hypothetical protein [Kineococcus rhizosphaerae]PRY11535.1 hypothetical protein CLV37_113159 [Kineococcus rhizosphaerae]
MLSAVFRSLARVRGAKALHPHGAVLAATVVRHGLRPGTGVGWVDDPGEDRALVRFSRGAGLPAPLPDVLGLALRVESPDGDPWDLLLSTTLGRRLPFPRRDARSGLHSSIAAFAGPRGRLLVGARWVDGRFLLAVATPRGPWRPFAELHVHGRAAVDEPVTFEPVRHAVPGLAVPERWRRLREPAYAGSRRGRRRSGRSG